MAIVEKRTEIRQDSGLAVPTGMFFINSIFNYKNLSNLFLFGRKTEATDIIVFF